MKTFIDYNWLSIKSLWYKPQKPSIFCLPWWHFHFRSILIKQITIDMSPVPWNKVELHAFFIRNPFIRVSTWDLNKLRNKYLIFEILRNFRSSSYGAKKLKYLNFSSSKEQICRKLRKSQSLNRNFMELLSVFPVHCTQHLSNCFLCYFLPTCVMICRVVFLNKLVFG